jgi:hypothetical protein
MNSGSSQDLNLVLPLPIGQVSELALKEWDAISDDVLGELSFSSTVSRSSVYHFFNTEEGSIYDLEIAIDIPPVLVTVTNDSAEAFMVTNHHDSAVLLKVDETSSSLSTVAGQVWTFTGVATGIVHTYIVTEQLLQTVSIPNVITLRIVCPVSSQPIIYTNNRSSIGRLEPGNTSEPISTYAGEIWTCYDANDIVRNIAPNPVTFTITLSSLGKHNLETYTESVIFTEAPKSANSA